MLSAGCAKDRIVPVPEIVEIEKLVPIPVPDRLLIQREKTTLPATPTYADALMLWAEDRAIIDALNGQIRAIDSLGTGDDSL